MAGTLRCSRAVIAVGVTALISLSILFTPCVKSDSLSAPQWRANRAAVLHAQQAPDAHVTHAADARQRPLYVDPGSGLMLLQFAMAAVLVVFYRFRSFFAKLLRRRGSDCRDKK
jgi:hypothetical protein